MEIRRTVAAAALVILCLGLSGLVLHRQIAAHPAPPETASAPLTPSDFGRPIDRKTWHLASGKIQYAVRNTIQNQLAAFRRRDADQAIFYETRSARSNFHYAVEFLYTIVQFYPEFGHARRVQFGPLWVDPTARYADVTVTVLGENGRWAQGNYQLLREDGLYRVAGVQGGTAAH